MKKRTMIASPAHRLQRGQTLVLVALSLVSLLAMAALAIDVVTLYNARTEIQRAADATALAGAKAFVDSGVTTDPSNTTRETLARSMSNSIIAALLAQNKVAGSPPVLVGTPTFDFTSHPGNPQITVTLRRTGLPIFFSRIWSRALASVSATATAEAYNPSESQANTGNTVPIQPKCVRPFLVANWDGLSAYIDPATGISASPSPVGKSITLSSLCPNAGSCTLSNTLAPGYYPAKVTSNPANLCPANIGSCVGGSDFEQSIECCDANTYSCGGTVKNVTADANADGVQSRQDAYNGLQCVTHAPSPDTLVNQANFLAASGPLEIRANSGPLTGKLVTTSNSIVTVPVFASLDTASGPPNAVVVGFLQVFIENVQSNGDITLTILNVAGCGDNPSGSPVMGGGVTPIPVRLIH